MSLGLDEPRTMTDPKWQEIEAKKQHRDKLAADAARIEADLKARSAKADEKSAAVEAAQAALKEAKLAQVLTPTKENAAAVAEAQKRVKAAYAAETDDLQDEDVYRTALARLNAQVKELEEDIKKAEFRRLADILKAHDPNITAPLMRLLAPAILLYRLGGGGGVEPDWGHFIVRYIKSGLLNEEVAALRARLMSGEVLP